MVSRRERAQLILAGAILLATLIFGLSLLLNSLLFTGASGATSADASLGETDLASFEIQRSVRAVVVRVNHAERNVTVGDLGTRIERNVTRYSRLLAESKAAAGSVVVNVSYDNDSSTGGHRIVQAHDAEFTDGGGDEDWLSYPPVPDSPDTSVGWFTANVDLENTTSTPPFFAVTAQNDSGSTVVIELNRSGGNVSVAADPSWGSQTRTTCAGSNGRALVDLYHGTGFLDNCQFVGVGDLSGPVAIDFQNGDRIEGKYEIVMNRSNSRVGIGSTYEHCANPITGTPEPPSGADPCVAPVIWSANLTTTVDGGDLSYENSYNLSLYAEDS